MTLPFQLPAQLGDPSLLLDQDASDAEAAMISWLSARIVAAIKRDPDDPLPMAIVREITNTEDSQQISAYPVVSVHTLAGTEEECAAESKLNHRRILYLARNPETDIPVDGRIVNVEWLETVERPIWVPYAKNDKAYRKVARYRLGLPFTDIEE